MTKSKFRISMLILLSLAILMFSFGVITLVNAQNTYAQSTPIAVVEGKSGASIRLYDENDGHNYEGIRFTFEIEKTAVSDVLGNGEINATMLVIPTELIDTETLSIETAKVAQESFGTAWEVAGDNYKFVATLYAIPANRYDIEVSAVMYFDNGETQAYSQVIARSMRDVAVAAYNTEEYSGQKTEIASFLKVVTDGEKFVLEGTNQQVTAITDQNGEAFDFTSAKETVLSTNAMVDVSEKAKAYDGSTFLGNVNLSVVTKIITQASDLDSLHNKGDGNDANYTANPVKGYFYVANDIIYADDPIDINFHASYTIDNVSTFVGTFDGNGHTIEYGIANHARGPASGLFGYIYGTAVIQNAAFIVKKVPTQAAGVWVGMPMANALAAKIFGTGRVDQGGGVTLKDIYVKYDVENYTPVHVRTVGIADVTYQVKYENVVVDMSNVKGINEALAKDSSLQYGVFGANTSDTYTQYVYSFKNSYVISDVDYIGRNGTTGARFAENDTEFMDSVEYENEYQYDGLNRFDDYDAAKAYFALPENAGKLQALGGFCDISMGFPFAGDKEAFIIGNTALTVNGENKTEFELSEATELTVVLTYKGQAQEIVLAETSDDDDILSVNGNVISFNGNTGATATVEVTATIEGISYSKVITVKTSLVSTLSDEILINKDAGKIFLNGTSIEDETIISVLYGETSIYADGVIDVNVLASVDLATPFTTTIETNSGTYTATNTLLYDKVWENTKESRIDMATFFSGIDITTSGKVYNGLGAKTLTGKYALAENIIFDNDLTRTTSDKKLSIANGEYAEIFASDPDTANKSVTFGGEFDGRGYTMRNVATFYHAGSIKNNGGIFGILTSGATIKNLAIIDASIINYSTDIFTTVDATKNVTGNILFNKAAGSNLTNITISDVYVEYTDMVDDIDFCVVKDMPSLVGSANNNQVSINNFVIVKKYVDADGNAIECKGNVFNDNPTSNTDKSENAVITNSYVMIWSDRMTHNAYDIAGFVRYQDYAAFEGAGIDLTSFNNANWAIVNGAPIWAALQA